MKYQNKKLFSEIEKIIQTNIPFVFLENYEYEMTEIKQFIYENNIVDKLYEYDTVSGFHTYDSEYGRTMDDYEENEFNTGITMALEDAHIKQKNVLIIAYGLENKIIENDILIEILNVLSNKLKSENSGKLTILFCGKEYQIPSSIKEYSVLMKNSLPNYKERQKVIEDFLKFNINNKLFNQLKNNFDYSEIVNDLKGLDKIEIKQVLGFLFYEYGLPIFEKNTRFNQVIKKEIRKLKIQKLIKMGTLSLENNNVKWGDIKGLENLFDYVEEIEQVIKDYRRLETYNIDLPKGILLLGEPGTGKSMSAKAIASKLKLELIKFDISNILGKYVGESEKRMRETLDTVQFLSPCVLWIDEIEKAFAGVNKDNNEVMRKIFGQLLTWMSDENKGVFVVATANNIDGLLPPEFLRKGRFDEIFYIDRPSEVERSKIIKLHLVKRHIEIRGFEKELSKVAEISENLVGADLEYCCNKFAIEYHSHNSSRDKDFNNLLKNCFANMEKNILEIRERIENKGLMKDYNSELVRLKKEFKEEIETLEILKQRMTNNITSAFEENVYNVLNKNVQTRIDKIVNSIINKKTNINNYRLASKIEKNEE
ncbi:ATP-binding protein [Staphylococcus hominis]|uniref:ATP-binding protein n=1 Tax=Staphylococcus hominis TaxID=1290 RepID=UPI0034CDC130